MIYIKNHYKDNNNWNIYSFEIFLSLYELMFMLLKFTSTGCNRYNGNTYLYTSRYDICINVNL